MKKIQLWAFVVALAWTGGAWAEAEQGNGIKYCEDISPQLKHYENSDALFSDLTVKAQAKAVRKLLKQEMTQFNPQLLDEEAFVQALLHIVEFEEAQRVSGGLLTPCIILNNARIAPEQRARFTPLEVGRICSFDEKFLQNQLDGMKTEFVSDLFDQDKSENIPASLSGMVVEPQKIYKKYGKELQKILHERPLNPEGSPVENTRCVALDVYPIELYALSAPYRKEAQEKAAATAVDEAQRLRLLADYQARLNGLQPEVFRALVNQESRWRPAVVSNRGAVGLTQLMPATAKGECGLTRSELRDPGKNLACGAQYLSKYLNQYNDLALALCAYNAGPATVRKRKCRVFQETRNYVRKIMSSMDGNTPRVTLD